MAGLATRMKCVTRLSEWSCGVRTSPCPELLRLRESKTGREGQHLRCTADIIEYIRVARASLMMNRLDSGHNIPKPGTTDLCGGCTTEDGSSLRFVDGSNHGPNFYSSNGRGKRCIRNSHPAGNVLWGR